MITIDKGAIEYIKSRSSSIVIELKLEPAIGGCPCSGKNVTGSYIPMVCIDEPLERERGNYCVIEIDSINVYYPEKLTVKEGSSQIRILLKKILFWKFLYIDGAKAIVKYN
jgi:hypothetical protein